MAKRLRSPDKAIGPVNGLANPTGISAAASGGAAAASAMPISKVMCSRMTSLLLKTPPLDGPQARTFSIEGLSPRSTSRQPRPEHPIAALRPASISRRRRSVEAAAPRPSSPR
jgi:hypothetical protein